MSASRLSALVLLSATAAGGACGCAAGPNFHKPAAPAGAGYAPSPLPETTVSAPIQGGEVQHFVPGRDIPFEWWELFQSPALDSLIKRAFKANPTIAAAQAALTQAQELVYAQRGFFFPTISALGQAERHKVSGNTNSSSTIGVQGNGTDLLPKGQDLNHFPHNQPSYYTFYTADLTVGFVPDVFGGNRRQMESLAAQRDAQRFALEATYITLASNVVAAAIQEASLHAQIEATREIIEADEKSLQILRDQFRLGFAMRIDVAAQEAALAQARTTLPPLLNQFEQTRDLMRALVGKLPNEQDPVFELDTLQLPPEVPLSLPAKIIEQRPDVRAAEAQLHAASAAVGAAVAAMLPQFSISGQYGGNATQISWMFRHGGPFWSLYGDVTQPVFQGGTLLHQERAAKDALKQAAAQYQSTVIAAYQNIADALHVSLSDAETLSLDVEAENSAKVTYDLTRRQMQAGYVTYLTLLSAETAYEQTLLTRVQAQATRYGDTVALFQALGGGWWNRKEVAAQ
ncbi:MAG TPA: efflux transporter outer membrane subunit [Steroidobacteraceae bacterium]|nr:efflux transporter outer membrane subunit [Steroidobacteraceae bacterium]